MRPREEDTSSRVTKVDARLSDCNHFAALQGSVPAMGEATEGFTIRHTCHVSRFHRLDPRSPGKPKE